MNDNTMYDGLIEDLVELHTRGLKKLEEEYGGFVGYIIDTVRFAQDHPEITELTLEDVMMRFWTEMFTEDNDLNRRINDRVAAIKRSAITH